MSYFLHFYGFRDAGEDDRKGVNNMSYVLCRLKMNHSVTYSMSR